MKCDCGNPAKILTGDKPLCWTCHRRKCGKEEWIIELMRPEDERVNVKLDTKRAEKTRQ